MRLKATQAPLRDLSAGLGHAHPTSPPPPTSRACLPRPTSAPPPASYNLQAQLAARGLHQPLPVQAAAVPLVLSGRDVAIKSCTGSGKVGTSEGHASWAGCFGDAVHL